MKAAPVIVLLSVGAFCTADEINLYYEVDWFVSQSNSIMLRQAGNSIAWSRVSGSPAPKHTLEFGQGGTTNTLTSVTFDFSEPEKPTWSGAVNEHETQGGVYFTVGDQGVVVEMKDAQSDFAVQFETEEAGLETLGLDISYDMGIPARCYCFGDSSLSCTTDQCDKAENCPNGNGGPKCRWGAAVVVREVAVP
jgi:hypothetical protein